MKSLLALIALAVAMLVTKAEDAKRGTSETPKRDSAATFVQVKLISDRETWVSIANVLQPVKFQVRNVSLPPGKYEVIGRRKGYRDEQKSLDVRGGKGPNTLTIICTVSAES